MMTDLDLLRMLRGPGDDDELDIDVYESGDELEPYEDDIDADDDDFEDTYGDNTDDEDETDDEVDHFYGEDGTLIHDTFEDDDEDL